MNREDRAHILSQIAEGTFILCVDRGECRWNIYEAKLPGSDHHSRERGVVFTDEPYCLPEELSPIRYWGCHYTIASNRYDFHIDAVAWQSVAAIYRDGDEMMAAAEQLREQERQYVEATQVFRDRFKVFAKLMTAE